MTPPDPSFEALMSDEVFLEGMAASDVGSLWSRLARTEAAMEVSRRLASDPSRLRALCAFAQDLLAENHDSAYRHPNDMAVCACLVLLAQSSLGAVRNLIERLRADKHPSLVWVQRMAEYCDRQRVETTSIVVSVHRIGEDIPFAHPAAASKEHERAGATTWSRYVDLAVA